MHEITEQTKFYNSKAEKTGWRDFIRPDFIKNLLPYGPSILELKGLKVKWINRINVRRLSWDFISSDFINLPSCQAAKLPNFRKRCAFAVAERHLHFGLLARGQGFTMAEILISLTIIGIIAAITLPSLRANINEKTWATQRKALYSRMSQAISMMPALNGYGEFIEADEEHGVAGKDTVAMSFLTNGLSKVLEMRNICDNAHLKDCGLPDKIKTIDGSSKITVPPDLRELNRWFVGTHSEVITNFPQYNYSYSIMNTKTAAFETKNGESILVFYNPYCASSEMLFGNNRSYYPSAPYMCANFIYDLNGRKGPNQVGKDIGFMGALYSVNSELVAPNFFKKNLDVTTDTYAEAHAACRAADGRLPNAEEGIVMTYNIKLLNNLNGDNIKEYHLQVTPQNVNISGKRRAINSGIISTLIYPADRYRIRCVEK